MPVKEVRKRDKGGKLRLVGYRFGDSGKLYLVKDYGKELAKKKARKQGAAIHSKG